MTFLSRSDRSKHAKPSFLIAGTALVACLSFPSVATADDTKSPAGYDRRDLQREYTAPLSQTTQPSYVPQSVALSGPDEIEGRDDLPVPPGYTPVQRTRKGPLIAGASVFGGLYFMSAYAAAMDADKHLGPSRYTSLFVPGIGPFIAMATTETATAKLGLFIDGAGQAVGLALAIYGLTSPKTVMVRTDLTAKPTVRAVPIVTGSTTGIGLTGTF